MKKSIKKGAYAFLAVIGACILGFVLFKSGLVVSKAGSFSGYNSNIGGKNWTVTYSSFKGSLRRQVLCDEGYMSFTVNGDKGALYVKAVSGGVVVMDRHCFSGETVIFPVYGSTSLQVKTDGQSHSGGFEFLSDPEMPADYGKMFFCGETHGIKKIMEAEFDEWNSHYHDSGMRDLFIELPYYTTQFLNLWMKADNDDILLQIYDDIAGTAMHTEASLDLYRKIKAECPETVFHGVDVGHQYATTGERYLKYLTDNGCSKTSKEYVKTLDTIEQGKTYYKKSSQDYREHCLIQNFVSEYNEIFGKDIMGIFGSAHTQLKGTVNNSAFPCLVNRLNDLYKDAITVNILDHLALDAEGEASDPVTINGKEYETTYFGSVDLSKLLKDYSTREVWRIENAYEDLKDLPLKNNVLPYNNYPMVVEKGQVFKLVYTMKNGSTKTEYHRSDGTTWNSNEVTQEINIK